MQQGQNLWNREELYKVLALYLVTPFGKLHYRNPDVIKLAQELGRTPGAVAFKLVNIASVDPEITETGRKGAQNGSKLDKLVWDEYKAGGTEWLEKRLPATVRHELELPEFAYAAGREQEAWVKQRINQNLFRKMVLAAYNNTCCITGLNDSRLLVAGHIMTWANLPEHRLDPSNGLCLNPLHDKAYERGLISIRPDYTLAVSKELSSLKHTFAESGFRTLADRKITLPKRTAPNPTFLEHHFMNRFLG